MFGIFDVRVPAGVNLFGQFVHFPGVRESPGKMTALVRVTTFGRKRSRTHSTAIAPSSLSGPLLSESHRMGFYRNSTLAL